MMAAAFIAVVLKIVEKGFMILKVISALSDAEIDGMKGRLAKHSKEGNMNQLMFK